MTSYPADMKLSVKVPFEGFYNSSHDAMFDSYFERESEHLEQERGCTPEQVEKFQELFISAVNWRAVHSEYARIYCGEVEKLLFEAHRQYKEDSTGKRYLCEGWNPVLEFESLESPKEYNFATDCIYAKVTLNDLRVMYKSIPADVWREFIKSKCTSYSGFISFYSPDFDAWPDKDDMTVWGEARLGMVLEAYMIEALKDESPSDINEALAGHVLMERQESNGMIDNLIWENASSKFVDYVNSLPTEKAA